MRAFSKRGKQISEADRVYNIKKQALEHGACQSIKTCKSVRDLLYMLFRPQGREFISQHDFPCEHTIRNNYKPSEHSPVARLYIASSGGEQRVYVLEERTLVVGKGENLILRAERKDIIHKLILIEGAEVRVLMQDYTMLHVTRVGGRGKVINLTPPEHTHAQLVIE